MRLPLYRSTITIACAALIGACASTGDSHPRIQAVDAHALGLNAPSLTIPSKDAAAPWWSALHDPQLTALIERSIAQGPTVQAVIAKLESASAQAQAAGAALGPELELETDVSRNLFSANTIYPPPFGGSVYTFANLQLEGSWELDLFGHNRARLKAAIGADRAAQADAQAAQLLLSTQVARQYYQLAHLLALRHVAERTLAQRQEIFALVRQRVQAGLDTKVEFLQGRGALPETGEQIEALNEQMSIVRHALAMLTAQPASALDHLRPELPETQWFQADETIPSDLLARRSDVQAALWRVEAAARNVSAAKAEFYPNINLTAALGYGSLNFGHLLNGNSEQYTIGPAIHLPLFNAGRLRAQLRGSTANLDAAVAAYNQSVLDAMRESADQLSSLQSIMRQQAQQNETQSNAEHAYDIAVQRYRAGLGNYLIVLQAENAVLAQRRLHADLQARLQDTSMALVHAMGGWPQAVNAKALASITNSPVPATHLSTANKTSL